MDEALKTIDGVVKRVTTLSLQNFRGFMGNEPIELNTDAELVLIAGPNGHGKSSLL